MAVHYFLCLSEKRPCNLYWIWQKNTSQEVFLGVLRGWVQAFHLRILTESLKMRPVVYRKTYKYYLQQKFSVSGSLAVDIIGTKC